MSALRRYALLMAVAAPVLSSGAVIYSAAPAVAAPTLTVLGPLVTVKSGDPTPAGSASASVSLARNEFESFQIAVSASGTAINSLTVDLAGGLVGAETVASLPTSAFTFYRESYYQVGADHLSDGESSVGGWPDALVPQVDYLYGEVRSAFRTSIGPAGRAVLWVDVLAGQAQLADTYVGTIRIKDGATILGTVPVSVTVRNFTLPSTSSLKTVLPSYPADLCRAHTASDNCLNDPVEANRLAAVYERVALENRVTISTPWAVDMGTPLSGANATNWRSLVRPIVNGTTPAAATGSPIRLPGARATALSLWWWCEQACAQAWVTEATNGGFLDRLHYYACDEPNQSATAWQNCGTRHAVAEQAGLRALVTSPIGYAQSVGEGAQAWIDDLVVITRMMAGKGGAFAGNQRPSYTAWDGPDATDGQRNDVWLYTSCESAACNNTVPVNDPFYNGWAGYAIDQPASQSRALPWQAFLYGASGELFWESTWSLNKAWNACTAVDQANSQDLNCQYRYGMNGDGNLFYPGLACTPGTGPGCIGGTTDVPVESLRLKRMRDGREDYEYLNLLAADPDTRPLAQSIALSLLGGSLDAATYSATFTQHELDQARTALGDALDQPDEPPGATLSISDASAAEGTGGERVMTFTVSGTGLGSGSADLRINPGTAGAGDYELLTGSIDMGSHETREVQVRITTDALDEANETFEVELWNNVGIGLADAVGVGTILDDDPPAERFRPDALVRSASGTYRGNNVYNTTATNQTITLNARRGVTRTFYVRITNDGNIPDNWSIAESRVSGVAGFSRSWFRSGSIVTAAVRDGELSFSGVPVGGARLLKMTVRPTRSTRIGQVGSWRLHAVHNPLSDQVRDVVGIRVKVVR